MLAGAMVRSLEGGPLMTEQRLQIVRRLGAELRGMVNSGSEVRGHSRGPTVEVTRIASRVAA